MDADGDAEGVLRRHPEAAHGCLEPFDIEYRYRLTADGECKRELVCEDCGEVVATTSLQADTLRVLQGDKVLETRSLETGVRES